MIPTSARFYNPDGPDHVAEVSAQQATDPDHFLVQVRRGPRLAKLRPPTFHGPYTSNQLEPQFAGVVQTLRAEGFWPSGLHAMLTALEDSDLRVRARAALRLGWRREREAVGPLLGLLTLAVDETCSLIDALGAIGDLAAIPAARQQAARMLLSRRRSGVEALRNLGDGHGLAEAQQRALDRLPALVRQRVEAQPNGPLDLAAAGLAQEVLGLEPPQRGLALDTLYELATPLTVSATHEILKKIPFDQAHSWRYVRSAFKRSMLRHDPETFGLLSHLIEVRGQGSKGTFATVKSGYDGSQRQTRIFGKNTQDFMRRLSWRYLRNLARYRPDLYAHAAAEAIIHYTPERVPPGYTFNIGFGSNYVLHRVLLGGSTRFHLDGRSMRFSPRKTKVPADQREQAFPELWDAQPRAYLRVLSAAQIAQAHVFAHREVIRSHQELIQSATPAELVGMLRAPYEPTVELALNELEWRFDPDHPDWGLMDELLADTRSLAQKVGLRWLRLTAKLWAGNPERIVSFLSSKQPQTRAVVLDMVRSRLGKEPELRERLARLVLAALEKPEPAPGVHATLADTARDLLTAELQALLSVAQLTDWIARGSPVAKALAGHLLGLRPEAVRELGLERIVALAQHEIAAVRAAAHSLLQSARESFRSDPSVLFVLVESDWEDTRTAAFNLLRGIDVAALGLDGLMGLLDSNRADVQEVGREMAQRHLGELPVAELVFRLVQHPHPGMRRFALELVVHHLPPGDEPLAKLKEFCRAALFDLWPQRKVKQGIVEFLRSRALEDEKQAAVVSAVLGDAVRVQGRADFETALEALVWIKMTYPDVPSTVTVRAEGLT
ncbi:MAG: hypothetical protein L0Z62_13820 [Gemmataceae bacterium]|nr:hypothetical protein [Gemmataceae bacterium]